MAKKAARKKAVKAVKYLHFRLYGDYKMHKVLLYVAIAFVIGLTLGFLLQPFLVTF
jgi:hypothetical protein